jgi:hypothetical protein
MISTDGVSARRDAHHVVSDVLTFKANGASTYLY